MQKKGAIATPNLIWSTVRQPRAFVGLDFVGLGFVGLGFVGLGFSPTRFTWCTLDFRSAQEHALIPKWRKHGTKYQFFVRVK